MASEDLKTGLDILHAALLDAGEAASSSGDYAAEGKRAVRQAYWSILCHARWPWGLATSPNVIAVQAAQRVTVNSIVGTTMTLSANLTPSMVYYKVYLESNQSVYRVLSHTDNTDTVTLDASYVESVTSGPAIFFKDEYALPTSVLRVWDPMWPRGWYDNPIPIIDKPLFEQRYGRGAWGFGSGIIEAACEVHPEGFDAASDNMIRQVRFAPWCEDALNIEHDYTVFHDLDFSGTGSTVDTPKVPREHRSVIANLATALLCINKDESKAKDYGEIGAGKLRAMVDQYIPSQAGRFHTQAKHSVSLGLT